MNGMTHQQQMREVSRARHAPNLCRVALIGDSLPEMCGYGQNPTSITRSGGTATATFASAHGIMPGDVVNIKNCNQAGYNGDKTVLTVPSSTTLTFAVDASTMTPATGSGIQVRTDKRTPGSSWLQAASARLGGALQVVCNAGVGGSTSSQAAPRVSKVVQSGANVACVWVGHNDLFWDDSTPVSTVRNNIARMCGQLTDNGITVLLFTCKPVAAAVVTTARIQKVMQLNAMLAKMAQTMPGVFLVDAWGALVDPASATAATLANTTQADNIHFNNYGADLVGQAVATVLSKLGPFPDLRPTSRLAGVGQVFTNPLFYGTGGTVSGGVTGTAPDGIICARLAGTGTWAASTAVRSTGVDGDAIGQNLVLTGSAPTTGDLIQIQTGELISSLAGYSLVQGVFDLRIANVARIQSFQIGLAFQVGGIQSVVTAWEWWNGMQTGMVDQRLTLATPRVKIPAGATSCLWLMQVIPGVASPITINLGRTAVYAS